MPFLLSFELLGSPSAPRRSIGVDSVRGVVFTITGERFDEISVKTAQSVDFDRCRIANATPLDLHIVITRGERTLLDVSLTSRSVEEWEPPRE